MTKHTIIGANSYIARNIIHILRCTNYNEMKLYDRDEEQLDDAKEYERIDILSKESVGRIDMGCDLIYVFVGKTGSINGFEEYDQFIDVNEKSLITILNEYRKQKSKAIIVYPSTRLIYKGGNKELDENAEKEFKTIYAINKYACEKYLEIYNSVFGISYCIFRICIPYGTMIKEATSYGTIDSYFRQARKRENITVYGDGEVRRTLTYIGDLCEAMIKGAASEKCKNDIFNIGGENYSLYEIAKMIADKYGVQVIKVPWPENAWKIETGNTVFNGDKLAKKIEYSGDKKFSEWIKE